MNSKETSVIPFPTVDIGSRIGLFLIPISLAILLIVISQYNFLLFHTLAELFAIIVAITMSVVAWQMYPLTRNNFLMNLGCGYFWIAALDLLHALSYQGINIFGNEIPDLSIELWVATRFCEALLLLVSPYFLNRALNKTFAFSLYGLISVAVCSIIFTGNFPLAFVEGSGLTAFKIYSEYFIIVLLALALYYLWNKRAHLESKILHIILLSVFLTMCAELAFTFYVSVFGLSNIVGHIFKLFSFFLIFVAVIRTTLREPFLALARSASTYDVVPDATIVVDNEGVIRQVNRAACALVDQAESLLLGQQVHNIFHPQGLDTNRCRVCCMQRSGEMGGPIELELTELNKWYDYTLSAIGLEKDVQGTVQSIRDISRRKQAEHDLQLSKKRLQLHVSKTPLGIIEWDNDFCVTSWNKSAERIFGYSEQEAIGRHAKFILTEDTQSHVDKIWLALQSKSGGERSTNVNCTKGGSYIHCDWYNTPLINEDGELAGVASMVMDITERFDSERQLEKNYKLSQAISRTLSVYVSGHEADDRVLFEDILAEVLDLTESEYGFIGEVKYNDDGSPYLLTKSITNIAWNEETRRLYEENIIGGLRFDNLDNLFGAVVVDGTVVITNDPANDPRRGGVPKGHPPLNAFMGIPLYLGGTMVGMVGIANRPGGYDKEVEQFIEPICQTSANVIGAVRSEKQRLQVQEELSQYRDHLEELVEERTTLLQGKTAELEISNKELESFSYSVSHDLRAPLRAIDGFSQAIQEEYSEKLDSAGKDYLMRVRSAAQRMGELIDDLLDLARVSRSKLKSVPVNLSQIAEEVIANLKSIDRAYSFEYDIIPNLTVKGDPLLLRLMMENLLSNAWKYSSQVGNPKIEFGLEKHVDGDFYYVKDNGIGFDMKYAEKLFGAFQRLHKNDAYEGTGVGLATVQRIMHRHGGKIWAKSEVGKGAIFYFTIP